MKILVNFAFNDNEILNFLIKKKTTKKTFRILTYSTIFEYYFIKNTNYENKLYSPKIRSSIYYNQ